MYGPRLFWRGTLVLVAGCLTQAFVMRFGPLPGLRLPVPVGLLVIVLGLALLLASVLA